MTKSKEVATQNAKDVVLAGGFDYGEEAGGGFEDVTSKDLAIPFLNILQSNSPQVVDEDPEGCKPGMIYNTVTRELFDSDKGAIFLPCHTEAQFVEWVPRDDGGGYVGSFDAGSPEVKKALEENDGKDRKLYIGKNHLIETNYVYGLVLEEDGITPAGFAVLSFTSTKMKPYRAWTTSMFTIRGRPPLWANRARIQTVKQKNDHGTFFNYKIVPYGKTWADGLINPVENGELIAEAKSFREMVLNGIAKADHHNERSGEGSGGDSGGDDDGNAPF
jgi:hypothetical protein